jgi:hypothetical protein
VLIVDAREHIGNNDIGFGYSMTNTPQMSKLKVKRRFPSWLVEQRVSSHCNLARPFLPVLALADGLGGLRRYFTSWRAL